MITRRKAIEIAQQWSDGSGDGLYCYMFAYKGEIHPEALDGDGNPRMLIEIKDNLRCVRNECDHPIGFHVFTKRDERELLQLEEYVRHLALLMKDHIAIWPASRGIRDARGYLIYREKCDGTGRITNSGVGVLPYKPGTGKQILWKIYPTIKTAVNAAQTHQPHLPIVRKNKDFDE